MATRCELAGRGRENAGKLASAVGDGKFVEKKKFAERGGEVVGKGNSAGDDGWVRLDVVEFAMDGRRIWERGWGKEGDGRDKRVSRAGGGNSGLKVSRDGRGREISGRGEDERWKFGRRGWNFRGGVGK